MISHESEVIRAYRQLESQAARMAMLAKQEDWESLISEEKAYSGVVEGLADLERDQSLDQRENDTKYRILEHILDHDLEIRSRLMARREQLSQLMAVSRRESALGRAYGAHALGRSGEPPPESENKSS